MDTNINSNGKTNIRIKIRSDILFGLVMALFLLAASAVSFADDTDIYKPKVRHNVMILMDSSGSMNWPLYDNTINYAQFYDYICVNRSTWTNSYDKTNSGYGTDAYYYPAAKKAVRTKIYLIYGNTGYASTGMTGDAGNPDLYWYIDGSADMKTFLTSDGELVDETGKKPGETDYAGRIGTEVDGTTGLTMITIDGQRLPNGKDVRLHNWRDNPDGSRVDNGFSGLVQAPGAYFSGYFRHKDIFSDKKDRLVTDNTSCYTSDPALAGTYDGRKRSYFFATGNWINMQMVFNLQVYAGSWKTAWSYCTYPPGIVYQAVPFSMVSKNYPSDAPKNYDSNADSTVSYVIYNGVSGKMRIHFSDILLWYTAPPPLISGTKLSCMMKMEILNTHM